MNFELSDIQAEFRKGRGTRDQMPTSAGSSKKQESSRKTSISALLTMLNSLTVWITTKWKILKEMGIPDHLTCLQRSLYAGEETTVRTRHETNWFRIEKGVHQGCILSPCLFNLFAGLVSYLVRSVSQSCPILCDPMNHSTQGTSCEMPGWMNHKLETRLPEEISPASDMQIIPL